MGTFKSVSLLLILIFYALDLSAQSQAAQSKDQDQVCCEWHFSGHLGSYIDRIAEERILNPDNWNKIYPEAEEAFRLREDDAAYPESGRWRGEFWGKYILSAIAASHYFHSDELKERIEKAVKGLLSTQEENGYIGTFVHSDFVTGDNWNVWTRKYTLWGLVEAYELLQDESILAAAKKFMDHLVSEVGPGAEDIVKTGNFYGLPSTSILQPVVKLYIATHDKKYLGYAEYIVDQWTRHPEGLPDMLNKGLAGDPIQNWFPDTDPYKWSKAYEFISNVEGMLELYKITGKQQYLEAAKNIHASIAKWQRTPIGSVGFQDKFVGAAGLINTLSEVCDAVYWNRLSFKLFKLTGEENYIDEIERTLYNTLLTAYNQEGTWGLRRLRMSHTHIPAQNHFLMNHQCCVDNLPRGLFQASEVVLQNLNNKIYLSLFTEGKGSVNLPSGKTAHISIDGDFLEQAKTSVKFKLEKAEKFELMIRMPRWSTKTSIKINGKEYKGSVTDNWMPVKRNWKDGDSIEIKFGLNARWEKFSPELFKETYHDLSYYIDIWASLKFSGATSQDLIRKYGNVKSLSPDDALPQKPAVTFFYGPIALARDIRVTEGDVFAPVNLSDNAEPVSVRESEAPPGIWKVYELNLGGGQMIKFCDFASAGNTWDEKSRFNTWCILKSRQY